MLISENNARESGSAYLTALLALVILTLLGLTLAATSNTEYLIGSHERGQTKVFYQAGAALNEAINVTIYTAECKLVESRWSDQWYDGFDRPVGNPTNFVNRGQSVVVPARYGFCNMCDVAQDAKGTRGKPFRKSSGFALARADRLTDTPENGGQTIGQSQVSAVVEIDPVDIEGGGGVNNEVKCTDVLVTNMADGVVF